MPADFPPPPARVVRVWLASLDRPPLPLDLLRATLVPDEARRMADIAFDLHRARWAAGRGLLRRALGAALDVAPEAVPLAAGVNGRPVLGGPASTPHAVAATVAFNVSHSGDRLAIAIARVPDDVAADTASGALPLGVDVEVIRPVARMDQVAARVFDEAEQAALDACADDAARRATFHRLWTRKEACMKATGAGFTLAPRTFHVDANARVQQVWLPAHACAPRGLKLTVHDLPAGEGATGAVAVAGEGWTVDARALAPMPE